MEECRAVAYLASAMVTLEQGGRVAVKIPTFAMTPSCAKEDIENRLQASDVVVFEMKPLAALKEVQREIFVDCMCGQKHQLRFKEEAPNFGYKDYVGELIKEQVKPECLKEVPGGRG